MARSMVERMQGAALLDIPTYEEVEADATATKQAATVVAIVAVCSGIGALGAGGAGLIGGVISALIGWLVWAGVTYVIGERLFGGTATWGELLRTLGFAQAPGVLLILALIPALGALVRLGVFIWVLITGIVAIRQALDFTTGKAILTALLGWLAVVAVTVLLRLPIGRF
jgi:hypothetical protein